MRTRNCYDPARNVRCPLIPLLRFIHPAIRIILLIILVLVSSGGTAPGQQASATLAKPTPAPTPIPLAKVPLEAQSALASLQETDANVSGDRSSADGIARTLSDLTSEIDARFADDSRFVTTSPPLDILYRLKLAWENFRLRLLVLDRELTDRSTSLAEQLTRVDQLNKTWQGTLQLAKQRGTPPEVLQRVQSVVDSVERTRQAAESGQDLVLTLQSHLSEQEARIRTALSSIEQAETQALKNIFHRDSRPIWSLDTSLGAEWAKQSGESFSSQLKTSTAFAKRPRLSRCRKTTSAAGLRYQLQRRCGHLSTSRLDGSPGGLGSAAKRSFGGRERSFGPRENCDRMMLTVMYQTCRKIDAGGLQPASAAAASSNREWYNGFDLARERERGLQDFEDHPHIADFRGILEPAKPLIFAASVEESANPEIAALDRRQVEGMDDRIGLPVVHDLSPVRH